MKRSLIVVISLVVLIVLAGCGGGTETPGQTGGTGGGTGSIVGNITDKDSGSALVGVTVTLGEESTKTDDKGNYSFKDVDAGTYTIKATLADYEDYSAKVEVVKGEETSNNFTMTKITSESNPDPEPETGSIVGKVTDKDSGAALTGVTVTLDGKTVQTDAKGNYSFTDVAGGTYTITATVADYEDYSGQVEVVNGEETSHNFTMTKIAKVGESLSLTVKSSIDDSPQANKEVFLYDRVYNPNDTDPTYLTAETDADGNCQFNGLPVGEYTLVTVIGEEVWTEQVDIVDGTNTTTFMIGEQIIPDEPLLQETIDRSAQEHEVPITISTEGFYTFKTEDHYNSTNDTIIEIYDMNFNLVASNDDSFNKPFSYLGLTLTPGDYVVNAKAKNNEPLQTTFTLNYIEFIY